MEVIFFNEMEHVLTKFLVNCMECYRRTYTGCCQLNDKTKKKLNEIKEKIIKSLLKNKETLRQKLPKK